jgi:hypothetical protein
MHKSKSGKKLYAKRNKQGQFTDGYSPTSAPLGRTSSGAARKRKRNKPLGALCENCQEITMRESALLLLTAVVPILGLSGCEIVGDIFQAGVWVGVLLVVGVIALIIWMVSGRKS